MHLYHIRGMRATFFILTFVGTASAGCACGYSVNSTDSTNHAVFTDLFESDFLHITDVTFNDFYSTGWQPQNYTQPKSAGPYGMAKESRNLIPNFIANRYNWFGNGVVGSDPGLQLWVRSSLIQHDGQQLVPSAEIVSKRNDILYGSFRIAMKTTSMGLAQNPPTTGWPVHLVVQNTTKAPAQREDVSSQLLYHLPFAPDEGYNEYRFDWLPDRIDYFVNSQFMWSITDSIPSTPGSIHISHWSDGNPFWSHGPPKENAVMTVSYVKAYFNSTNTTRTAQYDAGCPSTKPDVVKQICPIPDQRSAPNTFGPHGNETGHTYFFTEQHNMTVNQTIYENLSTKEQRLILNGIRWLLWLVGWYHFLTREPLII